MRTPILDGHLHRVPARIYAQFLAAILSATYSPHRQYFAFGVRPDMEAARVARSW